MNMFIELIPSGIMQGLILSLVALGVMIPFKILNFPDLTSEGSYPLGAASYAAFISMQFGPIESCIAASIIAGFAGASTAMLHLRLKINTLLAGIIISTMIYSINLRLMGKPNVALFEYENIFSMLGASDSTLKILSILLVNAIIIIPFIMFLHTEKGLRFRAVGANPVFSEKQGINISKYTIVGLFIGNALCGFAGSLMVQMQGYADIGMGVGIVVHALAALMIGEVIVGNKTIIRTIISPFCGALVYSQIQCLALAAGLAPSDMKLFTGVIVLVVLMIRKRI